MFYAILTTPGKNGSPFQKPETAPAAPGDPLRVSEDATLLAFENQPDRVFATQYARACSKLLWHMQEQILHPDDLPATETFSSYREFVKWIHTNGR